MTTALIPLQDVTTMAQAVAKSGLFGVSTQEQALALMLVCQAEGLHPMRAVRTYHIIKGRPAKKADAILAEFQERGGRVEWHEMSDTKCEATFSAPQSSALKLSWTLEDAKRAQLLGNDNWKKYPRAMLRARVISEGVRATMPSVIAGFYTPEEVQDFTETSKAYEATKFYAAATGELKDNTALTVQVPLVDAEYTEHSPEPEAPSAQPPAVQAVLNTLGGTVKPGPVKLKMPDSSVTSVPDDIRKLRRSLPGTEFVDLTDSELHDALQTLRSMADQSKDQSNRGVLNVVASFVETEINTRSK